MSESEIASELLRYAVDDPGQALGYHAGHWYLRELRGTQDIREFYLTRSCRSRQPRYRRF